MTDRVDEPLKLTPNELLEKHGPAGWLVRRLQAYALLGWILFGVTLALHFALILVSTLSPRPIVAVAASGRVLGTLEYLSPTSRSDADILAARHRLYTSARQRNPARWSRHTRNWTPVGAVTLNPERDRVVHDAVLQAQHNRATAA